MHAVLYKVDASGNNIGGGSLGIRIVLRQQRKKKKLYWHHSQALRTRPRFQILEKLPLNFEVSHTQ
jgi:hypothetical protein